jgi:hypothetical protein
VVIQRDKLEEEAVELRAENERMAKELEAHALCPGRIAALELEAVDRRKADDSWKVHGLEKKVADLELALKVSEARRDGFAEKADKAAGLDAELAALRVRANLAERKVAEQAARAERAEAKGSGGPTQAEFLAALEMFKAEQLMTCISERVFVHVVAPKTILQVGKKSETVYSPEPPSDAKVKAFLKREVEPHFEMIFKTLNTAVGPDPPRAAVEGQKGPDGANVRDYAERFNTTLANFIKKCLVD